jgi:hypothetical protein
VGQHAQGIKLFEGTKTRAGKATAIVITSLKLRRD